MRIIFPRCLLQGSTILLLQLSFLGSDHDPGRDGDMLSLPKNMSKTNLPVYCPCLQLHLFLLFLSELSESVSVYNSEFLFIVWYTPLRTASCMAVPVEQLRQGSHCPPWDWQWHPSIILVTLICSITTIMLFLQNNHNKLLMNEGLMLIS